MNLYEFACSKPKVYKTSEPRVVGYTVYIQAESETEAYELLNRYNFNSDRLDMMIIKCEAIKS